MTLECMPEVLDLQDRPDLARRQLRDVPHLERRVALRDRRTRTPVLGSAVSDPATRSGPIMVTWRSIIQGCGRELRERILSSPEIDWSKDATLLLALASSFRTPRGTNPFAAMDYLDAADGLLASPTVDPALRVVASLMRSLTYRELGQFADARRQLMLARKQLYSAEIPLQSRIELHAVILQHMGICQMLQSEFDGARRNLLRGLHLAEACGPWCQRAEGYGCVALIDFLTGSVRSAESRIQYALGAVLPCEGLSGVGITPAMLAQVLIRIERGQLEGVATMLDLIAANSKGTEYEPLIMHAMATLRESLGEDDKAIDALQELQLLIRDWEPGLAHRVHHLARISILTRRRETSSVRVLLAQLKPPDPSHSLCPAQAEARLELELGDFERAIELTTECLRLGDAHAPRTYAYASLVNAASHVALGDLSTADAIFERSLALAASSGLLRPFTSLPQPLLASLVSRATVASHPEVGAVLAKIAAVPSEEEPPRSCLLSPSESVVLGHILAGETQQHISRLLSVSPNTVKSHVRSIYRKLGVTSRSGAAQRARILGIIG